MKKLIFSFCLTLLFNIHAFSCTLGWVPFCDRMDGYDQVFAGVITNKTDKSVSFQLLEVFKGTETKSSITVWDGRIGDCNGIPESSYTCYYGDVGDTLIFALSTPITKVEFDWDVVGDYRKPINFYNYPNLFNPEFFKVANNQVVIEQANAEPLIYAYDEMVAYLNSNDCVSENNCTVENPLEDLPWVAELIEDADGCEVAFVEQFNFNNSAYIKVSPYGQFPYYYCPTDLPIKVYNCTGDLVCTIGGYGLQSKRQFDECEPDFTDAAFNATLLWEYSQTCENPLELELVQNAMGGCTDAIYAFNYQNQTYVYIDQICEAADGPDVLYNCNTDETCYIGGFAGPTCDDFLVNDIANLLNLENRIWSPPCNYEFSGTVISNNNGFIIELSNGEFIKPRDTDFVFYDGQQVELSYIEYPYDSQVKVICIREIATDVELFENYHWLSNLIDVANCQGGTSITEYIYPGGVYQFIHITESNDEGSMYFQDGTLYCSDAPGYNCIEFYNLTPSGESWMCDGPVTPPSPTGNNNIFEKYTWLSNYINLNNCDAFDEVNEYDFGTYSFVFVNDANGGKLYFEDGTFYCANTPSYDCLGLYGFNNPTTNWACENSTENCVVDDPFSLAWLNALIEDAKEDLCGIKEISTFQYEGNTYFSAVTGPTYPYCPTDIYGRTIYNCIGDRICAFTFGYPELSDPCLFEPYNIPAGEVIWDYYQDDVFTIYPWLSTLVNPNNCNNASIQIYTYGSFEFIYIQDNEGKKLYFQDGTFYCADNPNYSCVDAYELSNPKSEWTCEGMNQKQSPIASTQKIDFNEDLKVFPNPSKGQFIIEFLDGKHDAHLIKIINMDGTLIQSIDVEAGQKQVNVYLGEISKGMYLLQLYNSDYTNTQSRRIVIH